MAMTLLPNEQLAKDFVLKYSPQRCARVLDALCRRFDRRFHRAASEAAVPINPEWVYTTAFEKELIHRIKLGLSLVDTDTPHQAKIRILQRIASRGGKRGLKAQAALDGIMAGNAMMEA